MNTKDCLFTRLIEAVKDETVLYSAGDGGYMDKTARREAWERVSLRTGRTAQECEKRWQLLREKFGKKTRKMEVAGSGAVENITWPFYEAMSFLKGHIKRRRSRYKTLHRVVESDASTSFEHLCETPKSPLQQVTFTEESSSLDIPKRRKTAVPSSESALTEKFTQILEAYKGKIKTLNQEQTEDELFMKTALKIMEPLSVIVKDRIRVQILEIITTERIKLYSTESQ